MPSLGVHYIFVILLPMFGNEKSSRLFGVSHASFTLSLLWNVGLSSLLRYKNTWVSCSDSGIELHLPLYYRYFNIMQQGILLQSSRFSVLSRGYFNVD